MNIQVLWVDDEYKEDFVSFAEQEGIDIQHRNSAQEGIDEINRKLNFYHAVILDAKGILNKEDQKTGLDGLRTIRDYLKELNAKHYLPHFIFSGQPDYLDKSWFIESYGEFFTKGRDEQLLIEKIKESVSKKDEYIIHKKYSKVFEGVKNILDDEIHAYLTNLLISQSKSNSSFDDKLHFTQIRIILEYLFRAANKAGLLHDSCIVKGNVNLAESSLFLAGEETKYAGVKNIRSHFPRLIADAVKDIIFVTGAASHTADPEFEKNINIQEYRSEIRTPYLLYSLTFRMLDIIIWFDQYLKINNNYSTNVSQWKDLVRASGCDFIVGTVNRIADNGFGTFLPDNSTKTLSIIPKMVEKFALSEGQRISVETEKTSDKTHIKSIKV